MIGIDWGMLYAGATILVVILSHTGVLDRLGIKRPDNQPKTDKTMLRRVVDLLAKHTAHRPLVNAGAKRLKAYLDTKYAQQSIVEAQIDALLSIDEQEQTPQ